MLCASGGLSLNSCAHSKIFHAVQTACCNLCVLHYAIRKRLCACGVHRHVSRLCVRRASILNLIVIIEFRTEDINMASSNDQLVSLLLYISPRADKPDHENHINHQCSCVSSGLPPKCFAFL